MSFENDTICVKAVIGTPNNGINIKGNSTIPAILGSPVSAYVIPNPNASAKSSKPIILKT